MYDKKPWRDLSRLSMMIGGVPRAIIGLLALGWCWFLLRAVNRLGLGAMRGLVLGLLVAGLIGSVCGLLILTLPSSLVGALIRGNLGSNLTARHRPSLGNFDWNEISRMMNQIGLPVMTKGRDGEKWRQ